jgi:prepilin-type N-terminal cleavage/methylation domain-containing protein
MKTERRVSSIECRVPSLVASGADRSSLVTYHLRKAFTLIELLTVIAIIGVLAALLAPVLKNFSKPDVTVAATRQMLDAFSRARQLAIIKRSTVYMVFIPTNFWGSPINLNTTPWSQLPAAIRTSMVVTQMYDAQWNGYMMVSLRDIGDQPGRTFPKDLVHVKTLPAGAFIPQFKFDAPIYVAGAPIINIPYPTNRPDLLIYGFLQTNNIPFPTSDVETNALFMANLNAGGAHFITVPYIAFNYLGQLASGDGTLLPYDENIPLAYGSIAEPINPTNKMPVQALPDAKEIPPGNSTNISYNLIHIDRLTGRARLERQDQL